MSNGLYTGSNDLPKMTRSEYLSEYHEITTYFDEEKKKLKKLLPFCIILSIINVIVAIGLIAVGVPVILNSSFRRRRRIENLIVSVLLSCVLSFPLASVMTRMKQIKNKENERLKDLEDRKNLCIEIGTYDAEE